MKLITKKKGGFSLIELMIVVGILGILATLAVPKLQTFQARAKQAEAKLLLNHIATLQEAYSIENSKYVGYSSTSVYYGYNPADGAKKCTSAELTAAPFAVNALLGLVITPCDTKNPKYAYNIAPPGTSTFTVTATTGTGANNRVFGGSCTLADRWTINQVRTINDSASLKVCP